MRPKHLGGLGFRDLELFNLALLARQAWRLFNEPSTLSARILKASYFPETTLLEARLGARPSQIWRAIIEGRDVMKQGIIRRIGNGQTTDIWMDIWIPKEHTPRPITSLMQNPPTEVAELLQPSTGGWNEDFVRSVFIHFDADAILRIPVCTRNVEGFWAWYPDKKGRFSVSSAYKFLVSTKLQREEWLEGRSGSSSGEEEGKAWSALWKISIPSKIKVFIWRLARHSLPTTDVLHHRNMATQDTCPLCGCQDSWRHALISCTMSKCVWALSDADVLLAMSELEEPSAKRWLFELYSRMDHAKFTSMAVTLWAIWYARR